jgi:hypothetical protein
MSTSIAISSAANAQAAAAQAAAHAAKTTACMKFVKGYQHDEATIAESREYAGCIGHLHPAPLTDGASMVLKVAVVIIFMAMGAGVVRGFLSKDSWEEWWERYLFIPFFWGLGAACIELVLALIVVGVGFVVGVV